MLTSAGDSASESELNCVVFAQVEIFSNLRLEALPAIGARLYRNLLRYAVVNNGHDRRSLGELRVGIAPVRQLRLAKPAVVLLTA